MKEFKGQRVSLDGKSFNGAVFEGCTIVYSGGQPPSLKDCRFDGCNWVFEGEALSTLAFMASLYKDPGFRPLIDTIIDNVRGNRPNLGELN